MAEVFRIPALYLCCLLLAAAPGRADPASTAAPSSSPGLVQPFEIDKIVRDSGFTPMGLPQREGTTYVLRAIDSHEILMRVVVDARSGVIRAVNRIVPGTANGVVGVTPPRPGGPQPYGSLRGALPDNPLLGPPPHEATPDAPLPGPLPSRTPPLNFPPDHAMPAEIGSSSMGPKDMPRPLTRSGTRPAPLDVQPLPRPRPLELTIQKARPPGKVPKALAAKPSAAPAAASAAPGAPRRAPAMPNGVPQIATPD